MKVDMTTPANDHFSNYNGWLTELEEDAERVIGQPVILEGVVIFTSYLPSSEVCVSEGQSYLYALHYLTGTAYYDPILGEDTGTKVTDVDGDHYLSLKSCGLGEGMGSTPTLHSGGGKAKIYVQTSTGAIVDVKTDISTMKSGIHIRSWLNID